MNLGLIVAAGRGYRLGGPVPKQYLPLSGTPILARTAAALLRHPGLQAVQVLIHPDDRDLYDTAVAGLDLPPPLLGGATRQDSVRLGLEGVAGLNPDKILIHDGVRPFVAEETITAVLEALDRVPAAIAAIPVTDTLKRGEGGRVTGTVDRANLWRAQTPQGFRFRDILAAHRQVHAAPLPGAELTDDAMLAERVGMEVALVLGHEDNIKITTEPDLHRAEAMLRSRG